MIAAGVAAMAALIYFTPWYIWLPAVIWTICAEWIRS